MRTSAAGRKGKTGAYAPAALSIASTDSGGNAGLMADLRVFRDFRVHGCIAAAGVTAQNPQMVSAIHPVPPDVLRAQIEAVLSCYAVRAVKTGMLCGAEQVLAAAQCLERAGCPIVVDPVMTATSGAALLEPDGIRAMREKLLPLAFLATPNLAEAEILADRKIRSFDEAAEAAAEIHSRYGCAVLLKGGHPAGRIPRKIAEAAKAGKGGVSVDILAGGPSGELRFLAARRVLHPVSTHGTGCTLSAAIASCLALGETIEKAVMDAKDYVTAEIRDSYKAGPRAGVLA